MQMEKVMPDKLVKKTLVASSLVNEERHWQLIMYLANHVAKNVLETEFGCKIPKPAFELIASIEMAEVHRESFELMALETRNAFLENVQNFDTLQKLWAKEYQELANIYRDEFKKRVWCFI